MHASAFQGQPMQKTACKGQLQCALQGPDLTTPHLPALMPFSIANIFNQSSNEPAVQSKQVLNSSWGPRSLWPAFLVQVAPCSMLEMELQVNYLPGSLTLFLKAVTQLPKYIMAEAAAWLAL